MASPLDPAPPEHHAPSHTLGLQEATRWIAQLGGFLARNVMGTIRLARVATTGGFGDDVAFVTS